MDIDGEQARERSDAVKGLWLAAALAVVVLIAGAAWWWLSRPAPSPAATTPPSAPAATAPSAALPPATRAPAEESRSAPTRRRERTPREAAAPDPEPAEAPAPTGPVLVVDSDVPGTSVFLNRKYLGTTPLRSTEVTPGSAQLNASAEGYDGVVQDVEVAASGPTEVMIRFKEVRLDATVPVVHKHGMGSCEGTLRATPAGLRYDTAHKGDAFTLAFAELDAFDVDYLQKNLKVKKRGGKTWNFSTKAENADPLFVFHRDVEKARAKLASR